MHELRLDVAGCLSDRVGAQGIERDALEQAFPELVSIVERLDERRGTGMERWRDLPFDPVRAAHVQAIDELVQQRGGDCENLIVLGIGGSALGNIALQAALNPPTWNLLPRDDRSGRPRLFVLDNVDPGPVAATMAEVQRTDPTFARTIVNVVSKSGETAETAAQFLILRRRLIDAAGDGYAARIVATTDPHAGTLRGLADREGYATLPVPDGVGGRFSVLSPVGLFSAAMTGIDIGALLDGAAAMDERCRSTSIPENPAALLAWLLIEHARRGRSNHVMMPYANGLALLADWYRQLWAESLGKRVDRQGNEIFAGATPIRALGTTDQHSQVQLYREGPPDKVIGFVAVETPAEDVTIPTGLDVEPLRYLQGATLGQLLDAERRATEYAMVESGRPHFTITLPRLDAHAVGQFLQLWMIATAIAGELLDIDAYDQPAVETGKLATFGLMGREGYEDWKRRVDDALR